MFENLWVWLVLGVVPYRVRRVYRPGGLRQVAIRALFWTFTLEQRPGGRYGWALRVPLVEKLRRVVWAAVVPGSDEPREQESDLDKSA
ncbi:MAG: hypothetical protein L0332_33515 [Chloroflexi bacterium]|nr:hypothetical protein [Chloroflexota bacterium]